MTDLLTELNDTIANASPALARALSPLGRRIHYPPDIPFQAAEARGKEVNGTIGQITDGAGKAIALSAMTEQLAAMPEAARNRSLLYSPVEGVAEVRQAWRAWQRRGVAPAVPSGLPIVTTGLTHGLAIIADLFGGEGRTIVIPAPFWGNYRQTFAVRTGAKVIATPAYAGAGYDVEGLRRTLAGIEAGEPAVLILNLPSNPGGYSLTATERAEVVATLLEAAEARPLVVLCDDAYAGLVYEDEIPRSSLFWELAGVHPDLIPVKIDGATKELSFFGGRLGFLTFPFAPDSRVALALESKAKGLLRSTVGSPVAITQMMVLAALQDPRTEGEVEDLRQTLALRYRALRRALAGADPALLRPLPFNSGCFALVELPRGVDPEVARRHLLDHHSTGLISVQPKYLRIAFCSVAAETIPELVQRLAKGISELVNASDPAP